MNPEDLASELETLASQLRAKGPTVWQRAIDWQRWDRISRDSNRGGGLEGVEPSEDSRKDRVLDQRASSIRTDLLERVRRISSDARALRSLIREVHPEEPPRTVVQAPASCVACGETITSRALRGMDEACHRAWKRAGQPDLTTFKRDRETAA